MSELHRVLAELDGIGVVGPHQHHHAKAEVARDAARVIREMAADFERAGKRCDALDKMLVAYRVGRQPAEATFSVLEKHSREWLDAAREKWRLE